MKTCIFPGSFNPITRGHLDVIERASPLFEQILVALLVNPEKRYDVTPEVRREWVERATRHLPNVRVVVFDGLMVELAKRERADVVLRGIRNGNDAEDELQLAGINRYLSGIETLLMPTSAQYAYVSSSFVRNIAENGGSIAGLVPEELEREMAAAYGPRR